MKETFVARNMLVLLAVVAGSIAAIAWWLLAFGYPGAPSASANRETPVVQPEQRASVPTPGKSAPSPVTSATETIKGLADQLGALKPEPEDAAPKFDIARIEPNGEAVIAGRAKPGASVELLQDGKVHDRIVADSSGAFVFVPKPLPSGSYDLTLRTIDPTGKATVSKGAVAVKIVASSKEEKPVAALAAPKAPAVVLPKPAADSQPRIQIDAVEAEDGGRLRVAGRSVPGSIVRLYLNDAYIATGTASPDGRVEFSILGGVKPGEYRVRLEQTNAAGNVLSRVETAFAASAALAEAKPSASPEATPRRLGPSPLFSRSAEAPSQSALAGGKISSPPMAAPPVIGEAGQAIAASQRETPSPLINQTSPRLPVAGEVASEPPSIQEVKPLVATGSTDRRGAVVVPSINTKVVVRGDNLWRISQATYGDGKRYTVIYGANRSLIRNPNLIYPDQIFVLPNALPQ